MDDKRAGSRAVRADQYLSGKKRARWGCGSFEPALRGSFAQRIDRLCIGSHDRSQNTLVEAFMHHAERAMRIACLAKSGDSATGSSRRPHYNTAAIFSREWICRSMGIGFMAQQRRENWCNNGHAKSTAGLIGEGEPRHRSPPSIPSCSL